MRVLYVCSTRVFFANYLPSCFRAEHVVLIHGGNYMLVLTYSTTPFPFLPSPAAYCEFCCRRRRLPRTPYTCGTNISQGCRTCAAAHDRGGGGRARQAYRRKGQGRLHHGKGIPSWVLLIGQGVWDPVPACMQAADRILLEHVRQGWQGWGKRVVWRRQRDGGGRLRMVVAFRVAYAQERWVHVPGGGNDGRWTISCLTDEMDSLP